MNTENDDFIHWLESVKNEVTYHKECYCKGLITYSQYRHEMDWVEDHAQCDLHESPGLGYFSYSYEFYLNKDNHLRFMEDVRIWQSNANLDTSYGDNEVWLKIREHNEVPRPANAKEKERYLLAMDVLDSPVLKFGYMPCPPEIPTPSYTYVYGYDISFNINPIEGFNADEDPIGKTFITTTEAGEYVEFCVESIVWGNEDNFAPYCIVKGYVDGYNGRDYKMKYYWPDHLSINLIEACSGDSFTDTPKWEALRQWNRECAERIENYKRQRLEEYAAAWQKRERIAKETDEIPRWSMRKSPFR